MDITADYMVTYIVPIPAKHTTLNTVISKYGHEDFGYKQQKNLAEEFDVAIHMRACKLQPLELELLHLIFYCFPF